MCHRCGSVLRLFAIMPASLSPKRARRVRRLYQRLHDLIERLCRAMAVS